jgi:hypothetical protein
VNVTSPDNVLLGGRLASGAIPFAGSGYRRGIYNRDRSLVVIKAICGSSRRIPPSAVHR